MLRPPHTRYHRLFVYYLDRRDLPPIEDPDLIGVWIEDETAILFFHSDRAGLVHKLCRRTGARIIYQADLDYRDWEAGVEITPFSTRFLAVRPVWEAPVPDRGDRAGIVIDPSVIFGSGFHPTTRLCLETLERVMVESGTRVRSVLDLGTGTGLLAIGAAVLGADRVLGVDNNPLAVAVARNNVALNECGDRVRIEQTDLQAGLPEMAVDLVVVNLYKGLLLDLFARPEFWRARLYLVSGFLPGMEGELLAALPDKGVRMLHRDGSQQWRLWLLGGKDEK